MNSKINQILLLSVINVMFLILNHTVIYSQTIEAEWNEINIVGDKPVDRFCTSGIYDPLRNRMVIFGGWSVSIYNSLNDTWVFDLNSHTWSQLSTTGGPPANRAAHVAIYDSKRDRMVIFGGSNWWTTWYNDLWALDFSNNTWYQIQTSILKPEARFSLDGFYDPIKDELIIFGGLCGSCWNSWLTNETWSLNFTSNSWNLISTSGEPPAPRAAHSSIFDDENYEMLIYGGGNYSSPELNDLWSLNLNSGSWELITDTGPFKSAHCSVIDPSNYNMISVAGGGESNFCEVFDINHESWFEVLIVGDEPIDRYDPTVIFDVGNNRTILFGGLHYQQNVTFNDIWELKLSEIEKDIAVTEILSPIGKVKQNTTLSANAVVINQGLFTETFPVTFQIGTNYMETKTITLAPFEIDTLLFSNWIAGLPGTYVVSCSTALLNDEIPSNNKKASNVIVDPGSGPLIYNITPDYGGNTGFVTIEITGNNFKSDATVKLTKEGVSPIEPDSAWLSVVDSTKIITTIDFINRQTGVWNIIVKNVSGDSCIFYNGFTIEEGHSNLYVDIIGRDQIRVEQEEKYWVNFGSSGNIDACFILLISVPEGSEIIVDEKYNNNSDYYPNLCSVRNRKIKLNHLFIGNELKKYQMSTQAEYFIYLQARNLNGQMQIGVIPHQIVEPMWINVGIQKLVLPPLPPPPLEPRPLDPFVDFTYTPVATVFLKQGFDIDDDPPSLWDAIEDAFIDLFKPEISSEFESASFTIASDSITSSIISHSSELGVTFSDPDELMDEKPPKLEAEFEYNIEVETEVSEDIQVVTSRDPNDKAGPIGFGEAHHVHPDELFHYLIYFENDSAATAPAENITILDSLDIDLDFSTFAFGDSKYTPTSQTFDTLTGVITWKFEGINLPPNRTPPEGESFVSYSIRLKENHTSGTRIENLAYVTFDDSTWTAPMTGVPIFNTIDALPPSSKVSKLAEEQSLSTFPVQWSGQDDKDGSGIRNYSIYVSDNDSTYKLWITTDSTSAVFTGKNRHTYKFYSIAKDNVGFIEDAGTEPDALTKVTMPEGVVVSPNPFVPPRGHNKISFFGAGVSFTEIKIFNKAGELVRTLEEKQGKDTLNWDTINDDGKKLASGVYIYVSKNKTGKEEKGKFAIIK